MNYKLNAMRNKNTYTAIFIFILFCAFFVQSTNAQTLYSTISAPQQNVVNELSTESEGSYLIKDGELDEIYGLKLKTIFADSLTGNRKITFEQTRVMVLPIMGMVHFVGTLDIDGFRNTTSFQLGFLVNSDKSITFKGTKLLRLSDFDENLSKEELKLDIDFVLKNSKNSLISSTTKE